jgi:hypothetical protein
MRRPRAGSTQAVTRGTSGLRPPATRSGCQELAEGAFRKGRSEARSRGIYKRRGGTGASRTPATVERREAWTLIAKRPPRTLSAAPAASRTRRHQDAPRGAPRPLVARGCIPQTSGRSTRENANSCLKFGSGKKPRAETTYPSPQGRVACEPREQAGWGQSVGSSPGRASRVHPPLRGGMKRSPSFRPRRRSRREPESRIITLSTTVDRIQKSRKQRNAASPHAVADSGFRVSLRSPGMTEKRARPE